MKYLYVVGQQIVGAERCLFVIGDMCRVTPEDTSGLESLQCGVSHEIGLQVGIRHVTVTVVTDEPDIGITRLIEHGLKGQWDGAAMCVVGIGITHTSILKEAAHRAAPARQIGRAHV